MTREDNEEPRHVVSKRRSWSGADVVVSRAYSAGGVLFRCPDASAVRVATALDAVGGRFEWRLRVDRPGHATGGPESLCIFPEGVQAWGFSSGIRFVRHVEVSFDAEQLRPQTVEGATGRPPPEPLLGLRDDGTSRLLRLLADECESHEPLGQVYGDSLVLALSARMLHLRARDPRPVRGGLAKARLGRVLEFMCENLARRVELRELAELAGLSQSQFCHAFKVSTGSPPHHWHLSARVKRAQELMLEGMPFGQIASSVGFTDQAHFSRVFKRFMGASPRAWMLAHR